MKNMKKVLAVLLTLVMVFSLVLPAAAANKPEEVGFEQIDNSTVKTDLSGRVVEGTAEAPQYSSSDIVRVSIVLEGASTIDAGYSTSGIADNTEAMAYRETLEQQQAKMEQKISAEVLGGKKLDVVWNLTLAANIISANVAYGKIDDIKAVDGVKNVVIEQCYEPAVISKDEADPDMATSSEMIGSGAAYLDGYTGAGMRIAIIDTGVDTDHRSFNAGAFEYSLAQNAAEKGMTTEAYIESLDLLDAAEIATKMDQLNIGPFLAAKGVSADQLYVSSKIPFGFNYIDGNLIINHLSDKQEEHGSHVSGIATANAYVPEGEGYVKALGTTFVQGVAPDAQLITMKVFGKGGGAYDSDYMAAIEDAIVLGCDSINLSLGSGNPGSSYSDDYQAIMDSLAESDTVVVMSAGNSGAWMENVANGMPYLYNDDVSMATNGSPGSFTNSFTVASVDNIGTTGMFLNVGELSFAFSETDYTNAPIATLDKSEDKSGTEYDYVFFNNYGADGDGNNQLTDYANITAGKVVFVSRGTSSFYQKHMAVEEVGGAACIVYNNAAGEINMNLEGSTATIPCVSITLDNAKAVLSVSEVVTNDAGDFLYATGKITVSGKTSTGIVSDTYTMSSFSSWGVPGSLQLKPEITAPGGNIYSVGGAFISSENGQLTYGDHASYESMSGTSMAAPQVTGMSALVMQYIEESDIDASAYGMTKRALAQSLLMSTAVPVIEQDSGYYYSVMKQGAGVANVGNAVSAESFIKVDGQDDGKVKVELYDDPDRTGVYTASFSINNLTEDALTYNLSADFFTQDIFAYDGALYLDTWTAGMDTYASWKVDGVTALPTAEIAQFDFDGDGDTDVDDASALMDLITGKVTEIENQEFADVDADGEVATADVYTLLKLVSSTKVTVPAGGSVQVELTFALSEDQKEFFDAYYTSGAYIEGFIYATPDASAEGVEGVEHSIPVFGFYGNWSDASMYDVGTLAEYWYGTETRYPYLPDSDGYPEMFTNYMTITYAGDSGEYFYFGNPMWDDDEYLPERNGFNNMNGDMLYKYYFSAIRNAGMAKYVISDAETGEVYMEQELGAVDSAYYYVNGGQWRGTQYKLNLGWRGTDAEGNKLPEGTTVNISLVLAPEYYVNEDGSYDWDALGEGAYLTTMTTIDNTAPELTGVYRSVQDKKLIISAQDNEYISVIAVYDMTGEEELGFAAPNQMTPGEEQTVEIDLNDVEDEKLIVAVYDYAMNMTTYKLIYSNDNPTDEKTTSIELDPTELTILAGNTAKITATVEPWIVTDPLVWTSSDETVATVNASGIVTAVGKGECVITATSVLSPEISATCDVTVETVDYAILGLLQDEDGNPMSFEWDLAEDARWTKIADLENSICSATLSWNEDALTAYVMDSSDSLTMREINVLTGETVATGAGCDVPYWDMATSIFGDADDNDMVNAIYGYYVIPWQNPMAPGVSAFNISSALAKYTGANYLVAVESAGYYYDEEDQAHAELIWALDDAGYLWLFELTAAGNFYLFNFYATDLDVEFPGYDNFMQCSLVEATDGSALFLSHFDGETNVIYMLEPVLDADGRYIAGFASTRVGDVGQDVWPAPLLAVEPNATEIGDADDGLAQRVQHNEALADVVVEQEEVSPVAPFGTAPAKGSVNAVTVDVAPGEKPTDPSTATVKITADEAVNHGLYTISYNADEVEFVSAESNAQVFSVNATEGKVVIGFASEKAIEKDGLIATLTFKNKDDVSGSELTIEEPEKDTEPDDLLITFGPDDCYFETFTDCTDEWYHEAVDFAVSNGLMGGVGNSQFDPNGNMTRAMMVTVLYRMAGSPAVSGPSSFTDVPEDTWYSDAVAWAQDNGIVLGVLANKFAPNAYVTREQIATILWRYENQPKAEADLAAFADADSISDYAVEAMTWAVSEGIFNGDNGNLKPTDCATRAEFACIVMRYLEGSYNCANMK